MHILILPTWYVTPERPDLGIYFREHALALQKAGHQVGVLYIDFGFSNVWHQLRNLRLIESAFYVDEGIFTLRIKAIGMPKRFIWVQNWYAKLVSTYYKYYCQKVGVPELIHAQSYTAGFAAARIKQQWNVPFIYSEHLSTIKNQQYPSAHERMLQSALQNANVITAVSAALAGWLRDKTERVIQIIPNLVDTELFKPDLSKKTKIFTFLYVGDLIPIKAPEVLLRAFAIFISTNSNKNARLEIVGTGYLRASLEKIVQDSGISSFVHFSGLLPATTVVEKMQAANCLVLSSKTETFGVVQTEAMACGLPVIATNCGGPADVVTDDTGILVQVDNSEALANAMNIMLEQSAYYDPIKIRASTVERFGAEHVSQKWEVLYRSIAY